MLKTIADLDQLVGHDRCQAIRETTDLKVLLSILTEKKFFGSIDVHHTITQILKVATESDFQTVETVLVSLLTTEFFSPYYEWFLCHSILQVNPGNKTVVPILEKLAFSDDFQISICAKRDLGIEDRSKEAIEFQEYQTNRLSEILSKEVKTVDDIFYLFNFNSKYQSFIKRWNKNQVHENPGYYMDKYGKDSKFFDVFTAELNAGLVELPKC